MAAYGDAAGTVAPAAALTFGIVKNHPFFDGSKRTGFVAGILFPEMNGGRFSASEEDAIDAVLARAGGALDEAGTAAFLRVNTKLP